MDFLALAINSSIGAGIFGLPQKLRPDRHYSYLPFGLRDTEYSHIVCFAQ